RDSRLRAHRVRSPARRVGCRSHKPHRIAAKGGCAASRSRNRRHRRRHRAGRDRCDRRDSGAASGPEEPPVGVTRLVGGALMQFNLSEWALKHRSFVVYCMIVLMVAGGLSYSRLGRNEDPAFTFRTMLVQAGWPGATLDETLNQVTERIEQTLK